MLSRRELVQLQTMTVLAAALYVSLNLLNLPILAGVLLGGFAVGTLVRLAPVCSGGQPTTERTTDDGVRVQD